MTVRPRRNDLGMEVIFTFFDLVADGVLGRRWKRWAATCTGLLVTGLGLKLGAAKWLLDQYIEFRTSAAQQLLEDVVGQVELPSTEGS